MTEEPDLSRIKLNSDNDLYYVDSQSGPRTFQANPDRIYFRTYQTAVNYLTPYNMKVTECNAE